jgi:hypothetical protein
MTLPADLIEHGYKLIVRAQSRLFAVSWRWGCTGTKATLDDVIAEARAMIAFITWTQSQ